MKLRLIMVYFIRLQSINRLACLQPPTKNCSAKAVSPVNHRRFLPEQTGWKTESRGAQQRGTRLTPFTHPVEPRSWRALPLESRLSRSLGDSSVDSASTPRRQLRTTGLPFRVTATPNWRHYERRNVQHCCPPVHHAHYPLYDGFPRPSRVHLQALTWRQHCGKWTRSAYHSAIPIPFRPTNRCSNYWKNAKTLLRRSSRENRIWQGQLARAIRLRHCWTWRKITSTTKRQVPSGSDGRGRQRKKGRSGWKLGCQLDYR